MRAVVEAERLKPNYYALLLAIKEELSVSKACSLLGVGTHDPRVRSRKKRKQVKKEIKEDQMLEMIALKKEGKSYKEIGKMFGGLKAAAVYKRIKRHMGDKWKSRSWK